MSQRGSPKKKTLWRSEDFCCALALMKIEEAVETKPSEAMQKAAQTKSPLRKLYYWTMHWAETKFAVPALFTISFAEASFFPVPPDALLLPMCFSNPKAWWKYALWCTIASILGAIAGWMIGFYLWQAISGFFYSWIPGFTEPKFNKVSELYQQYGFWVIMLKGLTPIPFKIITISAGACKVPLWTVIIASAISRGFRFFLLAGLVRIFGDAAKPLIEKYLEPIMIACFVLLIGGIFALKFLPH